MRVRVHCNKDCNKNEFCLGQSLFYYTCKSPLVCEEEYEPEKGKLDKYEMEKTEEVHV